MAKTDKFRCAACGRTFAMAAHLGRHNRAIHAARGAPGHPGRPRAATPRAVLDGLEHLRREVQATHDELASQRASMDARLAALDQVIAMLGGSRLKPTRRPTAYKPTSAREGSLPAYIRQVLHARRGPITIKEVTAAVLRAGCKSRNKELPKTVGKYLAAMPNVVRIARGVFRMK